MKSKSNNFLLDFNFLIKNILITSYIWSEIRDNVGLFLERNIDLISDETYFFLVSFAELLDKILLEVKNLEKDLRVKLR